MKPIVINGKFMGQRITGVQRYAHEILNELDKLVQPGELEIAVPRNVNDVPKYKNIKVTRIGKLKGQLWEQISLPFYAFRLHAVTLNLCNVAPLISPGIVCIYDGKIKAKPEFFSWVFRAWYNIQFRNSALRAKKVFTISKFSQNEIAKYYSINKEKIDVIYCGWQHYSRIGYDDSALGKYGLSENNYIFALGSLEPNKNFKWIALAAKRNPQYMFAIAGSINQKIFSEGMGFDCPQNMKLLGYVSDEEAKTLMYRARAFLFPSFYEGFGIPPLEAISAGAKRIVVSNNEAMHEVFGDSVTYIDPNNADIDINAVLKDDPGDLSNLLQLYSWKDSAVRLYNILKNI